MIEPTQEQVQPYIDEMDRLRGINEELERKIGILQWEIKLLNNKLKGDSLYDEDGFEFRGR